MISVGQKIASPLSLEIVQGGATRTAVLQDLFTRRTIVSVYMKNNTGSFDKQNDSLAAHAAEFDQLGYNLIALSRDSCASHRKYAEKKGISYILASDPEDHFAAATASLVEKSMYGKTYTGPARAAYVFDTDGTVLAVIEKVDTKDHAAQLRTVLAGLRK